ncbi:MAG: hypothetical protein J6M47_07665 [Clostridia bacterium]|nr:hypothetical protein [Clostridia bacterium]
MKLNRRLMMVLALVMSLAMATTGTLAFLTDRDTVENTFTMGNVDIEVEEEFEQNSPLDPGVKVEKKAGIKNTHAKSDAWVWMTVSVPAALKDALDLEWLEGTSVEELDSSAHGADYVSYLVKHPTILKPGEPTPQYLQSVTLSKNVDYQDGKYVVVEGGEITATIGDLSKIDVIVDGYAMQTESFDTVDDAYTAYTTQWGGLTGGDSGYKGEPKGDDDTVTYEIPADAYKVNNSDELKQAILDGKTSIVLAAGEYNWSGTGHNGTTQSVAIYGESKSAVLKVTNEGGEGGDNDFDGYTVVFNNLTITSDNDWATGWKRMNATFNDCVINNNLNLVNGNHVFNYCTLNQTENQYNIWTYGASNAEFNYCTFNCAGKSIYVDGNRGNTTTLNINNCVFNDNGGVEDKAAIETGTTYGDSYVLKVNNTTVNGFAVNPNGISTESTLWANKNSMGTDKLNVVVDGVDVY